MAGGNCQTATPSSFDLNNYHAAYHIDPVTNFSGSSSASNQINLSWTGSHVHNEGGWGIWRFNLLTWSYDQRTQGTRRDCHVAAVTIGDLRSSQ